MFPFAPYEEPLYPLIPSPTTSLPDFSTAITQILARARDNTTIFSVQGEWASYRISLAAVADDATMTKGCQVAAESGQHFSGWEWALLVMMFLPVLIIFGWILWAVFADYWYEDPRRKEERLRMKRHADRMRKHKEEIELKKYIEEGKAKREVEEGKLEKDVGEEKARRELEEGKLKKDVEENRARREEEERKLSKDIEAMREDEESKLKKDIKAMREEEEKRVRVEVEREIREYYGMLKEEKKADERRVRREAEQRRL